VAQIREHASAAYYRRVDLTPLAGVRPGAAAAAIAGCLAAGSGATYCLTANVGGVRDIFNSAPSHKHKHSAASKKARAAEAPVAPAVTTPTEPATPAPPAPAPRDSSPQPLRPSPQDEFQPTNPGGGSASAAQTSAAVSQPAAKPAPVPSSAPGEFAP
jgi:hypothetical protein